MFYSSVHFVLFKKKFLYANNYTKTNQSQRKKSLLGYFSTLQTPKCWTGRFLMNLWAIFCLLVLSSYTANLAAVMVGEKTFEQVSGIHDDKVRLQTRARTCNCMHVSNPHMHYRDTAACTHKLILHKDKLMSKERNYLWRIIAFHIPKPRREFMATVNFIRVPSWYLPPASLYPLL